MGQNPTGKLLECLSGSTYILRKEAPTTPSPVSKEGVPFFLDPCTALRGQINFKIQMPGLSLSTASLVIF